jgi:hypothetical protein
MQQLQPSAAHLTIQISTPCAPDVEPAQHGIAQHTQGSSTTQTRILQYGTVAKHSTAKHGTAQHTAQYCTTRNTTRSVMHRATQSSTIQSNTQSYAQHNTQHTVLHSLPKHDTGRPTAANKAHSPLHSTRLSLTVSSYLGSNATLVVSERTCLRVTIPPPKLSTSQHVNL